MSQHAETAATDSPKHAVDLADYRQRIESAEIYDAAVQTPLVSANQLSQRWHNRILIKREDCQPVHSFKLRGAYNKMRLLDADARSKGVICASAGNHAQGVALGGRRLGIRAVIVMPETTPEIKVRAVEGFGGEIVLCGNNYDEAAAKATELQARDGLIYIPPYDDPDVIAGQGTMAREILEQHPTELDAIFVCVGGGGMLAGVAAYIKAVRPEIQVIGVEPEDAASMNTALAADERIALEHVGPFADGVAVKRAGVEPFAVCRQTVDAMMTVTIDELCAATRDIFEDTRALPEPAGALGVAGAKAWIERTGARDKTFAAIVSGANVNFDRLSYIGERAEIGEHREALLAVTIPEEPGAFQAFCQALGQRSISEFNYRYADQQRAHIFVGVKLSDGIAERDTLIADLDAQGYDVLDMSTNEMAKIHVRHMVGGRSPGAGEEMLFRVQFPERRGALLNFLDHLGERWNISLFHYRNHGHAHGLVLIGMQVASDEQSACRAALDAIGYDYTEETDNPSYQRFLHAE